MSMNAAPPTETLFYPFHLCHSETLQRLLARFHRVHFRDYMALQLSPFSGTTAYNDRMGGTYPELVAAGRLQQGHHVSGPLDEDEEVVIDQFLFVPAGTVVGIRNSAPPGSAIQKLKKYLVRMAS